MFSRSTRSYIYWGLHNWEQYVSFDFIREMYSIFLAHTKLNLKVRLIKPSDLYTLEAIDL